MPRVLVNIASNGWSVHFIGPDGKTRMGPWLLYDNHDEVLEILRWCEITEEELANHHSAIRRWGFNSAAVLLSDAKLAALIRRAEGWPWNGYELEQMRKAGRYPPQRLVPLKRGKLDSLK